MSVVLPRVWAAAFRALARMKALPLGETLILLMTVHPDARAVEVARFYGARAIKGGGETWHGQEGPSRPRRARGH